MKESLGKTPEARPPARPPSDAAPLTLARVYLQSGALEDAAELARQTIANDPANLTAAQLILADALRLMGRAEEATEVASGIDEQSSPDLASELNLLRARLLIDKGEYAHCIEQHSFSLSLAARSTSDVLLGRALAQCHARLKDLSSSRSLVEWTIRQSERIDWPEGIANGLMNLAILDRVQGHWSRADGLLLKARQSYARLGLSRQYIQATINLGLQRLWCGHLSFAEEALREAQRRAAEIADTPLEATARMDLGLALVRLNRMIEARQELGTALRLCRRQTSPRRTAIALEYTGEYHIANKDWARATAALRRALAIANRIAPEGDIVPELRRRQAEVALGLGNLDDALKLAQDADDRAARLGDRYERATALRVQGQVLQALGRGSDAAVMLQEALRILKDLGETLERDRVLDLLGESTERPDPEISESQSVMHETSASPGGAQAIPKGEILRLLRRNGIIGRSRQLVGLMRQITQIAPLNIPVLIQGETGTGKELFARAIHKLSRRPKGQLVAFNCATCPTELLDAELFGHARGAFTGANTQRLGLVRTAEGGTLFLDEIGELREDSQARLLRLLDSGEVRPLGSDRSMRVDVRIIAATHVDLEDRIRLKQFRRDLYFRLAGICLVLPPLRDRSGDLRELVGHFVQEAREKIRPGFAGFSERVLRTMERYEWPGNIRQLRLEIQRHAALAADDQPIDSWSPANEEQVALEVLEPDEAASILEDPSRLRKLIIDQSGQMARAARLLGVSRSHLYRVLKRLGISIQEFRTAS